MLKVVLVGSTSWRLRVWEILSLQGVVDEFAFVDTGSGQKSMNPLGMFSRSNSWLHSAIGAWDRVVLSDEVIIKADQLVKSGWDPKKILCIPTDQLDSSKIKQWVETHFPNPLKSLFASAALPQRSIAVGIFGTGSGGIKVWEALTMIESCEPLWFADNDIKKQGATFFGLNIIAPSEILTMPFSYVVIASMYRASISDQLVSLGIDRQKILAPSLAGSNEQILCHIKPIFNA